MGADPAMIAAVKQAGKNKRRDSNNNRQKDNTQNQSNQPRRCRPHELYGRNAWACYGKDCPDKDRPLASKPKNKKKKGEAAGADNSGTVSE